MAHRKCQLIIVAKVSKHESILGMQTFSDKQTNKQTEKEEK